MKKAYAEVIVDIDHEKLDRPFTYRIPGRLADECVIGCAVTIPFGSSDRLISGYVVGFTDRPDLDEDKIKEISAVTAGIETAEARLVQLAAWMSRRYGSTMIRAMKTVVPVRKRTKAVTEKTVFLTGDQPFEDIAARYAAKRCSAKMRVLNALSGGAMDMAALKEAAGVPVSVIRSMEEEGVLRIAVTEVYRRVTEEGAAAPPDVLNDEQQRACEEIRREWREGAGRPALLRGVTGSGKTAVYTELVADAIREGGQAIVLIPEIALTAQTVYRFVRRFGDRVSFLHSRLSGGERYDQMKAARKGDISVMVGPRSALFTPFPHLRLIVVDEEHEESYHSETMPRYYAQEVAVRRGELEGAHVLFGSATPSVGTEYLVRCGAYFGSVLHTRFGGRTLPDARIIDMRDELQKGNRSILSDELKAQIRARLDRGEQVMLFLNRRGYAGSVTCRSCGHVIRCPHCDISLTRHKNGRLICHYCGYESPDVRACPVCGSSHIGGLSVGTEQVEDIVQAAFPDARILRMDLDTTKGKDGHGRILKCFREGGADILIGTQMIVKGHDFPRVTLVGVLLADLSLSEADYRSSERTFQLVAQAVGRAGRGERPGQALIQTYQPDHFAIRAAAAQDYELFYNEEMAYRKLLQYPPEGGMLAILGSSPDAKLLHTGMEFLRKYIDRIDPHGRLMAIGPAPQSIGKLKDQYREVIYVRHKMTGVLIGAKDRIESYIAANSGFRTIQIQFDFS